MGSGEGLENLMGKFQVMPELTAREYDALRDDIRQNGIRIPIEVDENGEVLDGHTRQEICRRLKIDVPEKTVTGLGSDDEKRAYAYRMNVLRRHLSQDRRDETLNDLGELVLRLLDGHTQVQVGALLGIDQRRVSEIVSNTESGKAYKPDARIKLNPKERPKVVERLDAGETQGEVAADYGVSRVRIAQVAAQQRRIAERQAKRHADEAAVAAGAATLDIADACEWLNDADPCDLLLTDPPYSTDIEDIETFASEWLPIALSKVKPAGNALVFIGAYPKELLAYLCVAMPTQILGWEYRNVTRLVPTDRFKLNYQPVLYYRGADAPALNITDGATTSWAMQSMNAPDARQGERDFKWQKPLELLERYISLLTQPGQLVMDPFAGSGTTLLAAAKLGRVGLGCEVDTEVAEIAAKRGVQIRQQTNMETKRRAHS